MKARKLKEILNDTGYSVGDHGEYISVGSPMCHDLIKVEKSTLKLTYALDTWKQGRVYLASKKDDSGKELLFIWDTLDALIQSGEIKDIIEGIDEIENPLPVFTFENDKILATFTDKYGWPNTTIEGILMYDNTFFKNRLPAVKYGISETESYIELYGNQIAEAEKKLDEMRKKLEAKKLVLDTLKSDEALKNGIIKNLG